MKNSTLIAILIITLFTTSVFASTEPKEIPPMLKAGFAKYEKEGPKAALESWTKGSALEGSKDALSQANHFRQIEDFYGKYIGYRVVKQNQIAKNSFVYLIVIEYEKGDLFSKFFVYKKQDSQNVVTTFNFHTNAEAVWPASIVFGCEK